jgi:hypothetical protein
MGYLRLEPGKPESLDSIPGKRRIFFSPKHLAIQSVREYLSPDKAHLQFVSKLRLHGVIFPHTQIFSYCCTMLGYLITYDHQLYNIRVLDQFWSLIVRVTPPKTPFRLLIGLITIPITRNNNHSQLFITLCHIYTAYNHTGPWLQSLITILHWLTSQLSITVTNYHRFYIFTLRNSPRELTARIHFLRLLLNNSLLELLLKNSSRELTSEDWTKPANRFAYIAKLC